MFKLLGSTSIWSLIHSGNKPSSQFCPLLDKPTTPKLHWIFVLSLLLVGHLFYVLSPVCGGKIPLSQPHWSQAPSWRKSLNLAERYCQTVLMAGCRSEDGNFLFVAKWIQAEKETMQQPNTEPNVLIDSSAFPTFPVVFTRHLRWQKWYSLVSILITVSICSLFLLLFISLITVAHYWHWIECERYNSSLTTYILSKLHYRFDFGYFPLSLLHNPILFFSHRIFPPSTIADS